MTRIPLRERRVTQANCCPAGTHPATILSVVEDGDDEDRYWTVRWEVSPEGAGRSFEIERTYDVEEMADVVADLGIAKDREDLDASEVSGGALAVVRTFGGMRYAKVIDTEPLPQSA